MSAYEAEWYRKRMMQGNWEPDVATPDWAAKIQQMTHEWEQKRQWDLAQLEAKKLLTEARTKWVGFQEHEQKISSYLTGYAPLGTVSNRDALWTAYAMTMHALGLPARVSAALTGDAVITWTPETKPEEEWPPL